MITAQRRRQIAALRWILPTILFLVVAGYETWEHVIAGYEEVDPDFYIEFILCGELTIDFESHTVLRGEEVISLTPTEFRLLRCLAQNAGRVLSPERLLREVWGPQYMDETAYIRRYIWYLRQKIEPDPGNPEYILTEREFGYRFRKD